MDCGLCVECGALSSRRDCLFQLQPWLSLSGSVSGGPFSSWGGAAIVIRWPGKSQGEKKFEGTVGGPSKSRCNHCLHRRQGKEARGWVTLHF